MILSLEQIESVLFGFVELSQNEKGIRGYKCTKPVIDAWYAQQVDLGQRAETSTGIRLDFHTDATAVRFTVANGPFNLLVDGLYTQTYPVKEKPEDISLPLDGNEHRVTLIFPSHSVGGSVLGMELSDGASLTPHQYDEKFLFLGDSITQGWNSGTDCLSYAWRTSLFFNADCRIHGVGGGYFHPTVFEGRDFDPDRVFVAFGTNDFGKNKTLDDLRANAAAYLDQVADAFPGKKIYGITPIWRNDTWEKPMGTFDQCREVIREEHEKRGFTVIDGMTLVPHNMEFFSDTIHPNALGFSMYAQNLIKAILAAEK